MSSPAPRRPSLTQVLSLFFVFLMISLLVLLGLFYAGTQRSVMQASDLLLEQTSGEVESRVVDFLAAPETVMETFSEAVSRGLVNPRTPADLERCFSQSLLAHPQLSAISLTSCPSSGRFIRGDLELSPKGRGQLSVTRTDNGGLLTRVVRQVGSKFVAIERRRSAKGAGSLWSAPVAVSADPCTHLTFTTPVEEDFFGRPLWSDLHWSPRTADLPVERRDVEVSVQKALKDRRGQFLGVLRVSLRAEQLDTIPQQCRGRDQDVPLTIFLTDGYGSLITRLSPKDPIVERDDELRVEPKSMPPAVGAALARSKEFAEDTTYWHGTLRTTETYLVAFRKLHDSQDWWVGVLLPQAYYLSSLEATRARVLAGSALLVVLVLVALAQLSRRVRRDLQALVGDTHRMQQFSFEPSQQQASYREVQWVSEGLERAKTALRALTKYTPVAIVKELVRTNIEPTLGGETRDVTMLFTDVAGFTTLAEQVGINEVAGLLGDYLEVMGEQIQNHQGAVLEFVGDAIVAVWNAPNRTVDHAHQACLAVLDCIAATEALFSSPRWNGRPRLHTRYGLHRAEVVIGHFGTPTRMTYRVIGDGANLASRVEGLNKVYATEVLVTESVHASVREGFDFRELDQVLVVGRQEPVTIYELLGETGKTLFPRMLAARKYKVGLELYREARFEDALAAFEQAENDPPSKIMARRCRDLIADPPGIWDGVHRTTEK